MIDYIVGPVVIIQSSQVCSYTLIILLACRKWNDELEQTIEELRRQLEKACQDYFPKIKEKAIQVSLVTIVVY